MVRCQRVRGERREVRVGVLEVRGARQEVMGEEQM